jgi:hypothetical protein
MSINPKAFGLSDDLIKTVQEALKGKQKELDVAEPKGKLTSKDFEKLRAKKDDKEESETDSDTGQVDEASYSAKAARAGKDIGKPGKSFAVVAKSAAKRYGSKEAGERVAGAILKKLRTKE